MTTPSLVEELLADQQSLTAVEQFSRAHDEHALAPGTRYRNLIPLEAPRPGEQYAFEVELDKCSGCKACVTACHSLNGLDDNETWREVGLLINEPKRRRNGLGGTNFTSPILIDQSGTRGTRPSSTQHVTTACHHCIDPACLNGCPVLAYEKDPITGIVRHLDDQCIGCQYCVLKCPYDVPKYNERLGIVRKCDMCSSRLAVGEAPACVQACPNKAIRITKVTTSSVTIEFRERKQPFLSGAPAGDYTLPTTRYVATRDWSANRQARELMRPATEHADSAVRAPGLIAADASVLRAQPAHWPLVFMLVLSQAAVGLTCAAAFMRINSALLLPALALAVVSVAASVFHLGRPLGAWRFFLGLKRSWLSREILAFSLFLPLLATALLGSADFQSAVSQVSNLQPFLFSNALQIFTTSRLQVGDTADWKSALPFAASLIGLVGVFCSMMIYHDTRRTLWNWKRSVPIFFGTTLALGTAAALAFNVTSQWLLVALTMVIATKLLVEISVLRHVTDQKLTSLKKSALLITGPFQLTAFARMICAVSAIGCALLVHLGTLSSTTVFSWLPFALVLIGEILERKLFFRAVDAPKMPGGLHA